MNDSFSSARKCYISYINGYVDAKHVESPVEERSQGESHTSDCGAGTNMSREVGRPALWTSLFCGVGGMDK